MLSIYNLKSHFQSLLRPINTTLVKQGITANQVTIFALIISAIAGLSITIFPTSKFPLLCLPLVLFVRMALNAIDGMLAREHNMKSALGAILNELADVLADTFIYLPFALVTNVSALLIVIVVILSIIAEMTGVIGIQIGACRRYDGPMGKSDRALAFGILAFVLGLGINLDSVIISVYLFIILVLLVYTIYNRIKNALGEIK